MRLASSVQRSFGQAGHKAGLDRLALLRVADRDHAEPATVLQPEEVKELPRADRRQFVDDDDALLGRRDRPNLTRSMKTLTAVTLSRPPPVAEGSRSPAAASSVSIVPSGFEWAISSVGRAA